MRILVGSLNQEKVNAVISALFKLGVLFDEEKDVTSLCVPSGQNEQPVGFKETYLGALHRAQCCLKQHPNALAIGIENGVEYIDNTPPKVIDFAVVVVLTPNNESIMITSKGIEFPLEDFISAKKAGFEACTVAGKMRIRLKKNGDPHLIASDGKISREAILTDAIFLALSMVNKKILPR